MLVDTTCFNPRLPRLYAVVMNIATSDCEATAQQYVEEGTMMSVDSNERGDAAIPEAKVSKKVLGRSPQGVLDALPSGELK